MNSNWQLLLSSAGARITAAGVESFGDSDAEAAAAVRGTVLCDLTHYGLIRFSGEDCRQYLQSQLSCDVESIGTGAAQYGSYCTPQGRMLASFLLWQDEASYWMPLSRSLLEPIRKRLAKYMLRSKVRADDVSDDYVLMGVAGADAPAILEPLFPKMPSAALAITKARGGSLLQLGANRFQIIALPERAQELWHAFSKTATPAGHAVWDWLDIRGGIAFITPATQEQFVPQMANLDLIGGVSFSKGCYPGQEIVARMHYLGRLKQRMYLANIDSNEAPQPGDKLYSADMGGQASGMMVNAAPSPHGGFDVLAVIQIESAKRGDVRWKSLGGPRLDFIQLPYQL